jgi:hypothetical protein
MLSRNLYYFVQHYVRDTLPANILAYDAIVL